MLVCLLGLLAFFALFDALLIGEYDALKAEMLRAKEEFNEYERKDIKHQENAKFLKDQVG